ncbi:MAG: hypothetical protein ABI597_07885 [Gammaproteobacteria bacterium]
MPKDDEGNEIGSGNFLVVPKDSEHKREVSTSITSESELSPHMVKALLQAFVDSSPEHAAVKITANNTDVGVRVEASKQLIEAYTAKLDDLYVTYQLPTLTAPWLTIQTTDAAIGEILCERWTELSTEKSRLKDMISKLHTLIIAAKAVKSDTQHGWNNQEIKSQEESIKFYEVKVKKLFLEDKRLNEHLTKLQNCYFNISVPTGIVRNVELANKVMTIDLAEEAVRTPSPPNTRATRTSFFSSPSPFEEALYALRTHCPGLKIMKIKKIHLCLGKLNFQLNFRQIMYLIKFVEELLKAKLDLENTAITFTQDSTSYSDDDSGKDIFFTNQNLLLKTLDLAHDVVASLPAQDNFLVENIFMFCERIIGYDITPMPAGEAKPDKDKLYVNNTLAGLEYLLMHSSGAILSDTIASDDLKKIIKNADINEIIQSKPSSLPKKLRPFLVKLVNYIALQQECSLIKTHHSDNSVELIRLLMETFKTKACKNIEYFLALEMLQETLTAAAKTLGKTAVKGNSSVEMLTSTMMESRQRIVTLI